MWVIFDLLLAGWLWFSAHEVDEYHELEAEATALRDKQSRSTAIVHWDSKLMKINLMEISK
jgi:hypothetical protein